MLRLSTAILSFLLVSACSVGEVPPGQGSQQPTPDAAANGNGNVDAALPSTDAGQTGADASSGGVDPVASFTAQVTPIVSGSGYSTPCTNCHNGGIPPNLLGGDVLEARFKVKPGASNSLVTHGAHSGPALKTADAATIAAWIDSL